MMYMGSGYITQRKIEKEDYSPFKGIVDDSLTEVTAEMLDGATSISGYAFYQCANLTDVEIPSTVTTIGSYAFSSCRALTSINIPNTVTSIGIYAFYSCSALASVTVEATTPPTLGTNVFNGTSANLVIYVPSESVETYKAASGWSDYASKIQAIP